MDSWHTHRDPEGFSIELPAAWHVASADGRVDVSGPGGAQITFLPFTLESQTLGQEQAKGLLRLLALDRWPTLAWTVPAVGSAFGADGVRLVVAAGRQRPDVPRDTAALWWRNTPAGATGMFYRFHLPTAVSGDLQATVARILDSFRVADGDAAAGGSRPPVPDAPTGTPRVRWLDPTEGAFSLEVPAGWNVRGGVLRREGTSLETVASSPDGAVWFRIGDVGLPVNFIAPSPLLGSLGFVQGQGRILEVMSGVDFAVHYVQTTIGRDCQQLQFIERRDRPDHVQALHARGLLMPNAHNSAGEVSFSCLQGGRPRVGFFHAATAATAFQGTGVMWNVPRLCGFVASPDRAAEGRDALQLALTTTRVDRRWLAGELQHNQAMVDQQTRYFEYSAQLWNDTFAERWRSQERIADARGDLVLGVTRLVDPESGLAYKVRSGARYQWIDPVREVIVGTDLPYRPSWDFHELIATDR